MTIKFAAIGVNHAHIYGQVDCLKRAGAQFVGFYSAEDDLAATFGAKYPEAPRVSDPAVLLEDPSIQIITTAAIPGDRAEICLAAMRHGKDVLTDKPGMISFAQFDEIRRVQKETGRIFSVLYSEHFEVPAAVEAGNLIASGAIGKVVNTIGMGPHSLRLNNRPDWFFTRNRYGGILCDIASHQFEQFLFFSDAMDGEVVSASVANRNNLHRPGLQDVGDAHVRTQNTTGYVRVDWYTPEGLPTWGDGRLTILGTEGYIELRKYVDIDGKPGDNHLFLVDKKGVHYKDCSGVELPFGRQFLDDVRNRTETAMPQERCFNAMKMALNAQNLAEQGTEWAQ
ncbi:MULTISPECIES: Gfo/Idh/MocA family oxidoreductase [unclassified Devosia]|uniref:Gfo/Idh/MocA family protein n=1 Tax=unclassified Devosia TaxID=196773 RepID=UPI00145F83EB|nr:MULTISPECIES: Gfo/Idh/MocA family oxidoreductase [unclassified Devosia]MBJ6987147.1 Gfo/Idh/MocA family oxidoreductase [Devosia sp. MC521]QMW62762.1 Gfo/Idh/MocA family oxidoreductase [Devosia sp. MC521]